jgi:hypothetical protein
MQQEEIQTDIRAEEDSGAISPQTPETSPPSVKQTTMMKTSDLILELGDIIEITASNIDINEQVFYVMYVDAVMLRLFNISTKNITTLTINGEGHLSDESITSISLLNRSAERGFARQNGLLPKTWVDIHFGGEIPTVIVGEISNLEEDMIEIITFPEMKVIYIDFAYKGIPKDIPIENIVIRDKPSSLGNKTTITDINTESIDESEWTEQASIEFNDNGESIIRVPEGTKPDENFRDVLHKLYVQAADIIEEDLGEITQMVEVPEWAKKYSLETQVTDLAEQLLSKIPDNKRTTRVLNNIHFLTERFSQLRAEFSNFDDIGNVVNAKKVGDLNKPIVDHILEFDRQLEWLMPVVVNKRKLYVDDKQPTSHDAVNLDLANDLDEQQTLFSNYKNKNSEGDQSKYLGMVSKMDSYLRPFTKPNISLYNEELLTKHEKVNAALEGILNNLGKFQSSVVRDSKIAKRNFVIQRYCLGESRNADKTLYSGRKILVRQAITPNDEICVQSLLMFPRSVIEFSKARLPSTNIMDRAKYSWMPFSPSMALKSGKNVHTEIVDNLDKEIDYENNEEKADDFMSNMKHYILEDGIVMEEGTTFGKFLNVIFPKTRSFIRLVRKFIKNEFHFMGVVKELEPLGITAKHISFTQFMEIRYFIKEQIKEFKKNVALKSKEYLDYLTTEYNLVPPPNRIGEIFKERPEMLEWMKDAYKYNKHAAVDDLDGEDNKLDHFSKISSSELLHNMNERDGAQLYSKMISYLLLSLITPDKLMDSLSSPNIEDMTDVEKMKAGECNLRVIAKKYTSISKLQNDNNTEEVFFDKEYDDTPYAILSKYKEERKSKTPDHFLEYLQEVLVSKHDCPPDLAPKLAATLVAGKKQVKEGQYAILEIKPKPPPQTDLSSLSETEKEELERESELRTKTEYYKRMGDNWIHDNTVSEETFVNNNSIFCNLDDKCNYTPSELADKCLPNSVSALRMKALSHNRLLKELDNRFEMSVEQLEQHLSQNISYLRKHIRNSLIYRENMSHKQNDICVSLGNQILHPNEDMVVSPHIKLRDLILSQDDFVKKQHDIIRFVEMFTRENMTELNEDPNWRYCTSTNTKLFPSAHYELAKVFIYQPEDYQYYLDIVCREQGKKEDNVVVDKASGWVLKYLDLEVEEQYDESGRKIKSHDIVQKDLSALILESVSKKDKVFENPDTQKIYNIFLSLATNVGLKKDAIDGGIEEFVLRVSLELVNNKNAVVIPSEQAYNKRLEKEKEKQRKNAPPPYELYRDELIIIIVAAVTLVGIQSMIPSFKTSVTFPGCVQSFGGYPIETGQENMSGIKYISCILEKVRGSHSKLWKSVATIKADGFEKRILKIIQDFLLIRQDIQNLYILKREYLVLHPEGTIPADANVNNKWLQFQPPLVSTNMSKSLQGISADYETELLNAMQNGNKSQHEMISVLRSKLLKHAYGIVETINHVIQTKDALFLTSSKNPYLQNACCNEDPTKIIPLNYFIEENANIDTYIKKSVKMASLLYKINSISRGEILYHEPSTSNIYPTLPDGFELQSIYEAFIHYCKFDSDLPVPNEFLSVCSDKPREYERKWSLTEKIEFLRRTGKNYSVENLHQLMQIVNRNNLLPAIYNREVSQINSFKDVLEHLELKQSIVVEEHIRTKLWDVLKHYNPHVMVSDDVENEHNESLRLLNNALSSSSTKMLDEILDFISKYSGLSNNEYNKLEKFISDINAWKLEDVSQSGKDVREYSLYTVFQYVKNEVFAMSKTNPSIILNDAEYTHIPKHWNLSQLHKLDIQAFVRAQATKLNIFKKNPQITQLVLHLKPILEDLVSFIENIPIFAPIYKEGRTFYSLFSPHTCKLVFKYVWYSVLYEYIMATKHTDLINIQSRDISGRKRAAGLDAETNTLINAMLGIDNENIISSMGEMQEVEIIAGDKSEFYKHVAKLLVVYLGGAQSNKKMIDIPYSQIVLGVNVTQMNEKKKITDLFENLEKNERQLEYQLKTLKLGDLWSEGLRKSIFEYDKDTYDKSREQTHQFFVSDLQTFGIELDGMNHQMLDVGTQEARTVDEMQAEENNRQNEEYDAEGHDISHLRSGFMDGNIYSEDEDDDIWEE